MPNPVSGFTGDEIVERVVKFVGNTSDDFKVFVQNTLPLAEYRYFTAHSWNFLRKTDLTLNITNGTRIYTLDNSNVPELGTDEVVAADEIQIIRDPDNSVILRKVDKYDIRRLDPEDDDGTDDAGAKMWAVNDDTSIILYPPTFMDSTLKFDAILEHSNLTDSTNFPKVPFKYQESYIQYVIAIALERENDDRASLIKADALRQIQADVAADQGKRGDVFQPRIRSLMEAGFDGVSGNLEALLFANFYGTY